MQLCDPQYNVTYFTEAMKEKQEMPVTERRALRNEVAASVDDLLEAVRVKCLTAVTAVEQLATSFEGEMSETVTKWSRDVKVPRDELVREKRQLLVGGAALAGLIAGGSLVYKIEQLFGIGSGEKNNIDNNNHDII